MKNVNYSPQLIRYNMQNPYYKTNVINVNPVNLFDPKVVKSGNLSGIQVQNINKNNYNDIYSHNYIETSPSLNRYYSTPYINVKQLNLNPSNKPNSPIINNSSLNSNYNNINNNNLFFIMKKNNNENILYSPQKEKNINTGLTNIKLNMTSQHSHHQSLDQINQNIYNNNIYNNNNSYNNTFPINNNSYNRIIPMKTNNNNIYNNTIPMKNSSSYNNIFSLKNNNDIYNNTSPIKNNNIIYSNTIPIKNTNIIYNNTIPMKNDSNNNNSNNIVYLKQNYFINSNKENLIQSQKIIEPHNDINAHDSPIKKEITQYSTEINNQVIQSSDLLINKIKYIEPKEDFEPNEFMIIKRIGEGTYGKIYLAQWTKNNKKYAMKKEIIKSNESLKKNKEKAQIVKNFIKNTKSKGVIKIYGDLAKKKGNEFYYYVLMELAERDWEKELFERQKYRQYYKEKELFSIMKQLIKTLSLLQKNHITHRDIKPQNILITKGCYKISDFGEARILVRTGIIVSRVRGTELYMSPILFNGFRLKLNQISHNTFKSDVFSLGMCIFFASTLTLNSLCDIRELNDMKQIKDQLKKYLSKRYSFKLINILEEMLQLDEINRPDFIALEKKHFS